MASFKAVILDLDGVITRTADLHARVWKQMFDEFLARREEEQAPFDVEADYAEYVDGKPRLDGVRSFLASRGIDLQEGAPDDPPGKETVHGLRNRKNVLFHDVLEREGIEAFGDAVDQIRRWRSEGLKTAVVSSSRRLRRGR